MRRAAFDIAQSDCKTWYVTSASYSRGKRARRRRLTNAARSPATLLYDGDCGICRATAGWLGRRVGPRDLRLLALSDASSDATIGPQVIGLDLLAALHLVLPDGRILTGARAAFSAGRLVPRWGLIAWAFDHRLGHLLLGPVYQLVAGHRRQIGRLLRIAASCPMPSPAERPGSTGHIRNAGGS